jgi:hypothetical protein
MIVPIASSERSKNLGRFFGAHIAPMPDGATKGSAYVDEFTRTASASDTHEQDKAQQKDINRFLYQAIKRSLFCRFAADCIAVNDWHKVGLQLAIG